MSLIEKNFEYIMQRIDVCARDIAGKTGRWDDLGDYRSELYIELARRIDGYNPHRANIDTFISMILQSATRMTLRHHRSAKNRIIINAIQLESVHHEH